MLRDAKDNYSVHQLDILCHYALQIGENEKPYFHSFKPTSIVLRNGTVLRIA